MKSEESNRNKELIDCENKRKKFEGKNEDCFQRFGNSSLFTFHSSLPRPLTVYKASAGSGKTFTLAVEYIKLLIKNPYCYRNILAVTFTNKATEEMKMRILSQLYGIRELLPDSKAYIDKICDEMKITPQHASRQAGIALTLLIHHYNDFRIETIDSFFQSVLRNLARELDLTPNLRIELNDRQIEEEAVDNMIEKLDTRNEVLGWIIKFINSNIENDKTWNVISQIKDFGRNIFKEYYKRESGKLKDFLNTKGRVEEYEKRLHALSEDARKQIESYGDRFFEILENNGLTVDELSNKASGPAAPFVKISKNDLQSDLFGKRFMDALETPSKWTTAKSPRRDEITAIAIGQLQPLQQELIQNYDTLYKRYASARLTTKLITQLRLLDRIERNMREMNENTNRFLLSDTQMLLQSLIDDSDSPFVFEKIGTRLEHVMIDEFQDTSTIQWQNFKTLMLECMSHEDSSNLIVGDVKQSIYRWRSGDWRLLNNIADQFPGKEKQVKIKPLNTNFRSEGNIIAFNNKFFTTAKTLLANDIAGEYPQYAEELRQAYSDVEQLKPEQKQQDRGLVSIKLLDSENKETYNDDTLNEIADTIHMLLQQGASQSDIAILVRQNKHIPAIAEYFLDKHKDINIVSNEAFQLKASLAVGIIINAMRVVADHTDLISVANLVKKYMANMTENNTMTDGELFLATTDKMSLLPKSFTDNIEMLQTLPLPELAEKIYSIFSLSRLQEQSAYISTFYDNLSKFANDKANDISRFLSEWDGNLSEKTIKTNDVDGVRILSIHASKGLEFDNVIIPFCDWQLEIAGDTLWCTPQEAPYNELPLVPVNSYAGQLKGTIYEGDYQQEHQQNIVDNLNLLYVAFTRASANLFVIGQSGQKEGFRSHLIERCLAEIGGTSEGEFTFGSLYIPPKKENKSSDNVLLQQKKPLPVDIISNESIADFRQSNDSIKFIEGEDEEDNSHDYIKIGSILHEIFSNIRTAADIDEVLTRMQGEGVIYDDAITNERLTNMLHKRLSTPKVKQWFEDRWTILNEHSILYWDKEQNKVVERRPDRVITDGEQTIVIDFKFGKPKDEHKEQVKEYMTLLSSMSYPGVEGYLWYVYSNRVESVQC